MSNTPANPEAVEQVQRLFLRHSGVLRGFILELLPDHNRAEDVFQELFLTITRKAGDYRSGSNFLAWARTIARLKVLEQFRSAQTVPHLLDPDTLEAVMDAAEELDDNWAERRAILSRCLNQLAPRAREILELRYSEDFLPPPVIAARLSWTVNAVHVTLSRARKFLQDCTRRHLTIKES